MKMSNKIIISLIVCVLTSMSTFAGRDSIYYCTYTNSEVLVDGKPDELIWTTVDPVWFVPNDSVELGASSCFKALWDNSYLYFYIWMDDQDIVGHMNKRDDHLWHEEVIEIFIDADQNPKTYYEFEWNPLNTLLDLYVINPECNRKLIRQWWAWDCEGIRSEVQLYGTLNNNCDIDKGWALEVAIPFYEIQTAPNIPPQSGDQWKFDLTRREGTEKDGTLQKSSWLPPSCHFPLSYGTMIFKK